jgi:NADH:ubiquinone oxidoreductase subunit F (NADH-binding)/NADH:ubiquinone oxidoreductase subunit E
LADVEHGAIAPILAELERAQRERGWLEPETLRAMARRLRIPLHRVESVSSFYPHFRRAPPRSRTLSICRDLPCALAGASEAAARLRQSLAGRGDVELREVSCLGRCDRAPAALLGERPLVAVDLEGVRKALDSDAPLAENEARSWPAAELYASPSERYRNLRDLLRRDPGELTRTLEASGLRGMGGAGFPTGRKWALVAAESVTPHYVVCNADESEPGTFKDRQILADLPHLVIEGMALAAHCVGAERGFLFLRHEYAPERHRFESALREARTAGALGRDLFGSGLCFDIELFVSPGGYILGEETALLECLEDRRGEPRNKPPFPGQRGLYGRPTLMNNVETFVHAASILARGVEWWRGLGVRGHAGHKFIAVSGDVERPSVELVPFGTTLRELLERCGGPRGGARIAAVAPGGASSDFLPGDRLDVELDFETLTQAGSMLGSGACIFVAEGRDLLEVGLNVTRFFRNESCGKCVPCRVGTEKAVRLVESERGVSKDTRTLLEEMHQTLVRTSLCGLGQVALAPLLSLARHFPLDPEAGR